MIRVRIPDDYDPMVVRRLAEAVRFVKRAETARRDLPSKGVTNRRM
jgi:hypothetical protein